MALWAQWGLPSPSDPQRVCLPLSKHLGMMWSFDSGTGGLGQIPGLTRCVRTYVRVRGYSRGKRTGGLWGLCKWPQMANRAPPAARQWESTGLSPVTRSPATRDLATTLAGSDGCGLKEDTLGLAPESLN